jgi:hypothetical protein
MKQSKFESFVLARKKEGGGWLAGILALFVAFAVSKWSFILLEYLVICRLYGHAAWSGGLRIVDNHGGLSNGDYLAGWSYIILYMGTFVVTAPLALGSFWLFRYIGFRLRGRRWGNDTV